MELDRNYCPKLYLSKTSAVYYSGKFLGFLTTFFGFYIFGANM